MPSTVARGSLIAALVSALTLGGCLGNGDQGVEGTGATDRELLARASAALIPMSKELGAGFDALAYVDLIAAREQLGLPEDAEIAQAGKQRLLSSFASRPLFRFAPSLWSDPSPGPLGDVLDGGAIEAAAGTDLTLSGPGAGLIGPGDVLLVRTRQPFGEIAERLRRRAGYAEGPDGLLVGEPITGAYRNAVTYEGVPFPAVVDAGGGVVVFGGSARVAHAALAGAEAELSPAAKLVAELPGVGRVAQGGRGCVVAVGLGEDAAPREGELRVALDRKAESKRLTFGGTLEARQVVGIDGALRFSEPTASGKRASVRFSSTDQSNATRLPIEDIGHSYSCP